MKETKQREAPLPAIDIAIDVAIQQPKINQTNQHQSLGDCSVAVPDRNDLRALHIAVDLQQAHSRDRPVLGARVLCERVWGWHDERHSRHSIITQTLCRNHLHLGAKHVRGVGSASDRVEERGAVPVLCRYNARFRVRLTVRMGDDGRRKKRYKKEKFVQKKLSSHLFYGCTRYENI